MPGVRLNIAGAAVRTGADALARGWGSTPAEIELSLFVVGLPYQNKGPGTRAFEVAMCPPGEPVELRPEPGNPADRYAIAVYSCRGIQLGYLTAERAPYIGAKMAEAVEHEAVFQEGGATAAVIRVRFGGGSPTVPGARVERERRAGQGHLPDDFYPDDEPGEWGA